MTSATLSGCRPLAAAAGVTTATIRLGRLTLSITSTRRIVRVMNATTWVNDFTGQPLDRAELCRLRRRAHDLYLRNAHVFEDELDALAALGVLAPRCRAIDG